MRSRSLTEFHVTEDKKKKNEKNKNQQTAISSAANK